MVTLPYFDIAKIRWYGTMVLVLYHTGTYGMYLYHTIAFSGAKFFFQVGYVSWCLLCVLFTLPFF